MATKQGIRCGKCGKTVPAKKDGTARKHLGYVVVCGMSLKRWH